MKRMRVGGCEVASEVGNDPDPDPDPSGACVFCSITHSDTEALGEGRGGAADWSWSSLAIIGGLQC